MTLLAFAAEHHRLIAIRYLLLLSINGRQMDGQTGGRTDAPPFHRPCSAMSLSIGISVIFHEVGLWKSELERLQTAKMKFKALWA